MTMLGWVRCALLIATSASAACSQTESCVVTCAQDADCPDGQGCTLAGRCSSEDTCPCEPGAFLACTAPGSAAFCADTGDTTRLESCGAAGCNADAGRCNECVPGASTCVGEMVSRCGSDGLAAATETCALPCVDDSSGARCGHIVPVWLPDVCDADAAMEDVSLPDQVTLDTTLDANCPEVVPQAGGPELCVYHAHAITLSSMSVVGSRPIAFVADEDLQLDGAITARGDGSKSGPGGGVESSGGAPVNLNGGGGAGFKSAGAEGGTPTANAHTMNGGASFDPTTRAYFAGGPASPRSGALLGVSVSGGGGGGGVLLISCRGTVRVTGGMHVGGGGGGAGKDLRTGSSTTMLTGGGGGGAGGYVVIEGADVALTGSFYANGGGGGAGCSGDDCIGQPGSDGPPSLTVATGGIASAGGGHGGNGATKTTGATAGNPGSSSGGGGGGTGMFQVYTPAGRSPTITPSIATPDFETPRTVETR